MAEWTLTGPEQQSTPSWQLTGPDKQEEEKPFGLTDTWPFRLGRGMYSSISDALTLPGDVYTGKQDVNDQSITGRALNFAGLATPSAAGKLKLSPSPVKAPSEAELMTAGADAYKGVREAPVALRGDMMRQFSKLLQSNLKRAGYFDIPENSPSTFRILQELEKKQGAYHEQEGLVSANDFIALRQALQEHANSHTNGKDAGAAKFAIKKLDELWDKAPQTGFVAGTPAEIREARRLFKQGREDFAAGYRSQAVTRKENAADLQSSTVNSGQNYDNKIRGKIAQIIDPEKPWRAKGYNQLELDQMRAIAEGSLPRNAARRLGNMMGGGGGLGTSVWTIPGAITALGSGDMRALALGLGVPAAGAALKAGENYLTKKEVNDLANTIRLRSPQGAQRIERDKLERAMRSKEPPPLSPDEAYKLLLLYQMQNPNQT